MASSGHAVSLTGGALASRTGWKAQNFFPASKSMAGLCSHFRHSRIRRAHRDPFLQHFDLARGQFALRRHLCFGIGIAHGLDEMAFRQIAGNDGRAVVATSLPARLQIERQAAFDLLLMRMALVAALLEHWQHLGFKERHAVLCPR
jgi:hypothetical protein